MEKNCVLNRVFSKSVLFDWIKQNQNECYVEAVNRYVAVSDDATNLQAISSVYKYLSKKYRNEYFYKNTLLNKLIVSKHKIKSTGVLTELPIAKSKADFVMLNGKAIVYEIKTELDNLDRLQTQINDYYKCFDHVCIVTSETHLDKITKFVENSPIGVCFLDDRNQLQDFKHPEKETAHLNHEDIFNVLRKKEFESIIVERFGELPQTNQFSYYRACLDALKQLDINVFYEDFFKCLKLRTKIEINLIKVPMPLRFLTYMSKLNSQQYDDLLAWLQNNMVRG